jgi:hypothetical protein
MPQKLLSNLSTKSRVSRGGGGPFLIPGRNPNPQFTGMPQDLATLQLQAKLHRRTGNSRPLAGTIVPAGTLALARSPLALRCSNEQNALHTLIHQRHLTPSCGGRAPTAERTMDPARTSKESLASRPELENSQGQNENPPFLSLCQLPPAADMPVYDAMCEKCHQRLATLGDPG